MSRHIITGIQRIRKGERIQAHAEGPPISSRDWPCPWYSRSSKAAPADMSDDHGNGPYYRPDRGLRCHVSLSLWGPRHVGIEQSLLQSGGKVRCEPHFRDRAVTGKALPAGALGFPHALGYDENVVTGDRATQEYDLSTVPDAQRRYGVVPHGTGWRCPRGAPTSLHIRAGGPKVKTPGLGGGGTMEFRQRRLRSSLRDRSYIAASAGS